MGSLQDILAHCFPCQEPIVLREKPDPQGTRIKGRTAAGHLPRGRMKKPCTNAQERRLAAARCTDQGEHRAAIQLHGHIRECMDRIVPAPVVHRDILKTEHAFSSYARRA